jgi:hypothetical protein
MGRKRPEHRAIFRHFFAGLATRIGAVYANSVNAPRVVSLSNMTIKPSNWAPRRTAILSLTAWAILGAAQCQFAFAENGNNSGNSGNSGAPQTTPNSSTNSTVKIFSDDVFKIDSGAQSSGGGGYKTTPKGNTVYMAEEPNYNTQQYEAWKKSCEHLRETPAAYRDCFQSEKNADLNKKKNPTSKSPASRKGSSVPTVEDPYDSVGEEPHDSED